MGSFLRTPSAACPEESCDLQAQANGRRYENHFSRARQPGGSKSGWSGSARWCGGAFWCHDAHAGRTPWRDPGDGLGGASTSMISIWARRAMPDFHSLTEKT
jgi:hypothetical protein